MNALRLYKIIALLLVAVNLLTLFLYWRSGNSRESMPHTRKSLVNVLALKGEAEVQVHQLEKAHFQDKDALIARSRSLHEALFRSFDDPHTDSAYVRHLIDRIVENQRETEQMTYDYFREVSRWCNATQRVKLQHAIRHALGRMGGPPHRRR